MAEPLKLEQFGGMLPAWDDHLLPAGQASLSVNGYLFSGSLIGWRQPKLLRQLTSSTAKMAYRVPTKTQATALAILMLTANPNEGDTVTLGDEVYKFTATVTNPYDVKIGATKEISAQNLYDAFTLDNNTSVNQGTLYGTGTCTNPAISQATNDNSVTNNFIVVKAPDVGEAFNTTPVATSAPSRLAWDGTTFRGGINPSFDSLITGAAKWLEFDDPDTAVMRSPVVDDKFDRYYFASPSQKPKYNTYDRIQNGDAPWLLGIPPPGCAPGVVVEGGGDQALLGFPNSISVNVDALPANSLILIPITPVGNMELNDISFMPGLDNATVHFAGVVYEDNAGSPGLVISAGSIVTGVTSGVAATSAFLNPVPLTIGTKYWIGIIFDALLSIALADDLASVGLFIPSTFSNGPPGVAPVMAHRQDWQLWGTLTTSSELEARAYVYTWVTEYGEESQPSPPTLLTGWSNGKWTVSLFQPPPDFLGGVRNIKTVRLYRTIPDQSGQTVYFLVTREGANAADPAAGDLPIGTETFVDTVDDSIIGLNSIMQSTNWAPPPDNLQDIRSMPNGMAVGFKDNEVWFCEPYRPHAWPAQYVITVEFPIVGLGVTGNTVVVCTAAHPYIASGVNPSSMALLKLPNKEPCHSRGSIIGHDDGVYYASPKGLVMVNPLGKASNLTEMWITFERWKQLTPQKNLRAIMLCSAYFAFGATKGADVSVAQQGFNIELNNGDAQSFSIWPQPGGHRLGFGQMTAPNSVDIDNVLVDPWTGIGLLIQNHGIYFYDFDDLAPIIVPYRWRSKIYQHHAKTNLAAFRVFFDVPDGSPALSAKRNEAAADDPSWNALGANQYLIVKVYADGDLWTVREVRRSGELLRILSGEKVEDWQFEFMGRVRVSNMQVASSVSELKAV